MESSSTPQESLLLVSESLFENNDSFSECAKNKYLNNSSIVTESESAATPSLEFKWSIPDVESGSYLNTLETKLHRITNGRGLGKSLRMGAITQIQKPNQKKKIEYSGCKKCLDYFEEEIDLSNVPKEELIGATPLLESDVSSDDNHLEESDEQVDFEDLQIKELEEASWHQDYLINEEEKQVIYDKKTGELTLEQEDINAENVKDLSDNEDSESEEELSEDEDIYNNTVELHDDEEENDHFDLYQTSNMTEQEDWEAEFP